MTLAVDCVPIFLLHGLYAGHRTSVGTVTNGELKKGIYRQSLGGLKTYAAISRLDKVKEPKPRSNKAGCLGRTNMAL
jgi:hypothetical protein